MADRRRILIAIYVVMAIAVAIVAPIVFKAGQDLTPEHSVAGGYALLTSSGRTAAWGRASTSDSRASSRTSSNPAGSLGGAIRVESRAG